MNVIELGSLCNQSLFLLNFTNIKCIDFDNYIHGITMICYECA